jgi:gliding motility-associated-like protein
MNKILQKLVLTIVVLLFGISNTKASHLYGADFYYTWISGNTYRISLVIYGDCSGNAFPTLSTAVPTVEVYNNTSFFTSISLTLQAPTAGVEVSPVCPSQLFNTKCNGGTEPGVKRFTYQGTVTLSGPSNGWIFKFNGDLGSSTAGRSNAITNINFTPPALSSVTALEATLNNVSGNNSSPVYTTIPTPFFCVNKPASYNPGTVDINGDNLVYSLVPGLDAQTGTTVSYKPGFSGTSPLAAATGSFSFSPVTGQLNFEPNLTPQHALVVNKVEEYRDGVLVGTSMREMTFVILNTCSNNPPGGSISNPIGGNVVNNTTFSACQSAGTVSFRINPTDLDGNAINVSASGLPAGATFNVLNNNTSSPQGTFSWNVTGVANGTYNFFITYTDDGCPLASKQTLAYTVNISPAPSTKYLQTTQATCTKKAKFEVTNQMATPITIQIWQGATFLHGFPGVAGIQQDSLAPGTYTLRIITASNCIKDSIITIAPPVSMSSASITTTGPTCSDGNNGKIVVSGIGGTPPYNYALNASAFQVSGTFNNLLSGSYLVRVRDNQGCIYEEFVDVNTPPIHADVTFVKPPCNFFNSGSITVNAINGTAPYQYALGAGAFGASNTFSGLFSGTYVLHIKDANGCLKDTTVELPDMVYVHADATVTDVRCFGDATGVITLNAKDATAPYKYQILPSGTLAAANTFNNLPAGTYNFHIEDVNRCYLDTTIEVKEPTRLGANIFVTDVRCNGENNGRIVLFGTGGTPAYQYAFGAGTYSSVNTFNNLVAGTYALHIRDALNCIRDTTIEVKEPQVLGLNSVVVANPKCNASADGTITVNPKGGTTPYTYSINAGPFNSSNILSGLSSGTYTITVRDNNLCLKDTTVILTDPTIIIPSIALKNSTCATLGNGQVYVGATGGTPAYQYAVDAGTYSSSNKFSPLPAGTYIFHIKDNNGCIKDTTINIIDSLVVNATYVAAPTRCFGQANGTITVSPSGATAPYTYAVNTGSFSGSNPIQGLAAGNYTIHVKDANGCRRSDPVTVNQPDPVGIRASIRNLACFGEPTGRIILSGIGGTTEYNFAINNLGFSTANVFNNLAAGQYKIRISDKNGCAHDSTIEITQPTKLHLVATSTDVLCYGTSTGSVSIVASGGTPRYRYGIDARTNDTINTIINIPAGTHVVRVVDTNGCKADTFITFKQPDELKITQASIKNPTCDGFADGSMTLEAKGGTPGYQYAYEGVSFNSSPVIESIKAGTYKFTVKDANNCTKDTTMSLVGFPAIVLDDIVVTTPTCFGLNNGSIFVKASGGLEPLRYQLGTQAINDESLFPALRAGKYTVRVVDNGNCVKDSIITMSQPDDIATKITATPNDCEGADDGGLVSLEVEGGTKPYAYKWSTNPPQYNSTLANVANGTYSVIISDANSCTDTATATIIYDDCCKVFVANAFTPNNDGRNDIVHVKFKADFTLKVFMIYNRFGQEIFKTTDINQGWDGSWNGNPQDIGTYNYYVKGICGNKGIKEVEYKGTITLLR